MVPQNYKETRGCFGFLQLERLLGGLFVATLSPRVNLCRTEIRAQHEDCQSMLMSP